MLRSYGAVLIHVDKFELVPVLAWITAKFCRVRAIYYDKIWYDTGRNILQGGLNDGEMV